MDIGLGPETLDISGQLLELIAINLSISQDKNTYGHMIGAKFFFPFLQFALFRCGGLSVFSGIAEATYWSFKHTVI